MNFDKVTNWKLRNSWKYRLNVELENILLFGNIECSMNEPMRLHLMNLGIIVEEI